MKATEETRIRRAFIVRPFGTQKDIDFDLVEKELIAPALEQLGIPGRTTAEILRTGNIRTDMFQELVTADIVIADLSIHNANVYYELGIRHALRRAATVLIRGKEGGDKIPFDLFTDRYFTYDEKTPANSREKFVDVLYATIQSSSLDSPVFQLLPELIEQEPESFVTPPQSFVAAVATAQKNEEWGDLALLAEEIEGKPWTRPALRMIGRAQFDVRAMEAAKETWESILRFQENDIEANTLLGTIHQKLDDLAASDVVIDRVLAQPDIARHARAEALALKARNAKSRWAAEWWDEPDRSRARKSALASGWLQQSFDLYYTAFRADLTQFFPGINAVGLLVILIQLGGAEPETWRARFKKNQRPEQELENLETRLAELIATVESSIAAAQDLARAAGVRDLWADVSEADLSFYRGESSERVRGAYSLVRGISSFQVGAVRAQLEMFLRLGIYEDAARAALETLPEARLRPDPPHVLLFSGHRVDDPGRATPRFPPDKVEVARQEIALAIDRAIERHGRHLVAISGAASGGDILFLEECRARGIGTRIFLAIPKDEYAAQSVSSAGPEWTRRYYDLLSHTPPRVLQPSEDLPRWLADRTDYTVWQRNNLWMLHHALANGSHRVTLITLWNGQAGDGPGGTAHMVDQIRARGGEVVRAGLGTVFPEG